MFIIDFRNKKVSQYGFSVVNNNDVDIVHIYSHFVQYKDYLVYLKVESEDKSYVDEILIDSENISVEEGALLVKWTMGAISTQCKKIYIQLEFREGNEEDSKVAQTNIVSITLGDTIDTSEGAKHLYPQILKELQRQIDELKVGSVSDFDLDYTNDVLTITLFNEEGEAVSQLQATIPTSNKVDKIEGKGLSTNDFTDALEEKLQSILVTNQTNKVYGTNANGEQATMPVDNVEGKDGNIARRKMTSGQLSVPTTPVADDDATAKQYVDKFGKTIELSVDQQTYVLTATLKDAKGNVLASQQVDLPLESMVVSGSYDAQTQSIILTLQNGSTITIPVAGLISGLVSQTDFDALALRVTTAEGNIITLGNTKVNYSDINVTGGFVISITKNGSTYPVAEVVNVSATPKVVQSTSNLPAQNDGNLYVVLDNGYLYAWSNGWQQLYKYSSDLLTITEVYVGDVIYSYVSDKGHSNRPIQVESAIRDGEGNIINETYAKRNDYCPQLRSGLADDLATDRQIDDPELSCPPITMGITGGEAEVKTGIENFEYMEGKSKKFNQLADVDNAGGATRYGITYTTNTTTHTIRAVGTCEQGQVSYFNIGLAIDYPEGHKILITGCPAGGSLSTYFAKEGWCGTNADSDIGSGGIATVNSNKKIIYQIIIQNGAGAVDLTFKPQMIDLTAIYGAGNEPTSVEQFKADYPLDYYAYNAGEILSAKVSKLISRGRQQWDEEWEVGYWDTSGHKSEAGSCIRCANHIPVIESQEYYVKNGNANGLYVQVFDVNGNRLYAGYANNETFTTPAGASYMVFHTNTYDNVTTYNHDITISVYFEDGEGYDKYYSYSAQEVTLPNIELRSIGDIKDIAYASGGGKRRIGIAKLKDLTWLYDSGSKLFYTSSLNDLMIKVQQAVTSNVVVSCSKYALSTLICTASDSSYKNEDKALSYHYSLGVGTGLAYIYVCDSSYTDATTFKNQFGDNDVLIYVLATETELTENEGWDTNVMVDNYGTLEFVTDPQQVPQVEQPYFIKYTISLKEFLDGTFVKAGGNPQNIVVKEELDQEVENFEKGTKVAGKSQVAENLTPYDDESGTPQNIPFVNQGTGCGNGESIVDTGSYAELRNKNGNAVVVNQYAQELNSDNWLSESGVTATYSSGVANIVSTIANNGVYSRNSISYELGHKYLYLINAKNDGTTCELRMGSGSGSTLVRVGDLSTNWQTFTILTERTVNSSKGYIYVFTTAPCTYQVKNVFVIDLTLWFGSNDRIPTYLLNHPEAFFNYYRGSLAYNAGTLVPSNAQYLECIGRNVWDEEAEQGTYNSEGQPISDNCLRSKATSPIKVSPNTQYYWNVATGSIKNGVLFFYDANDNFISEISVSNNTRNPFTTPANCCYLRFRMNSEYGLTYNNNITISRYYEGESGYDQYYPYKVLTLVDTGTEVLRSAGNVCDSKAPNGVITRRVGVVNLGLLTWNTSTGNAGQVLWYCWDTTTLGNLKVKPAQDNVTKANIINAKYANIAGGTQWLGGDGTDKSICVSLQGFIVIRDSACDSMTAEQFKQAMQGVYLFYELAEYKEEQGTSFNETLDIDDFGSMQWKRGDDDVVEAFNGVSQGCDTFYPVDYKASLDTLIKHCDGDMERIVLDTNLEESEAVRDSVDAQLKEALGGTLKNIVAIKGSISFDNVEVVDLGTLNWEYSQVDSGYVFYASLPNNAMSNTMNTITTKYKRCANANGSDLYSGATDKCFGVALQHISSLLERVYIRDNAYTDVTAFKNSLKGVLLAYEKAQ